MPLRALVLFVALGFTPLAWAEEAGPAASAAPAVAAEQAGARPELPPLASDPPPDESLGLGWLLLRTLVVLGIVVASIYLTLNYGLRRLMGIKGMPSGRATVVQVIERIPLDQKRALFVVKAAGEYLLVGGGEGSLSLVTKLDPAEVDRIQAQPPAAITLSPFLQKLLARKGGPPPPSA